MRTTPLATVLVSFVAGCSALGLPAESKSSAPSRLIDRLDDLASIECPTLRDMMVAARKDYWTDDNVYEGNVDVTKYSQAVGALARCGEAKMIFEDIASLKGSRVPHFGLDVLREADEASSGAVFTLFQQYAKENAGPAFLPRNVIAADHIGRWLLATDRKGCTLIATATEGSSDNTRRGFQDFFIDAQCGEALAILVERLSSPDPEVRNVTCAQLGQVGDKSVLEQVELVAKTDRAFKFGERYSDDKLERDADGRPTRKYFVACSCQIAAELIRQRAK